MDIIIWILGTFLLVYICSKIRDAFFSETIVGERMEFRGTYTPEPEPQHAQPQESIHAKEPASVYRPPRQKFSQAISSRPLNYDGPVAEVHPQQPVNMNVSVTRVIHDSDNSLLNTMATVALMDELTRDRNRDHVIEREVYVAAPSRGDYVAPSVTELDDTTPDSDMRVTDQDQAGDVESMQAVDDESPVSIDDSATPDEESDMSINSGQDDNASYDAGSSESSSYDSSSDSSYSDSSSSSDSGGSSDW